jgi:hypothetical protein
LTRLFSLHKVIIITGDYVTVCARLFSEDVQHPSNTITSRI